LRDHTNPICDVATTVYQRKQGMWQFGRKLIVKTMGSGLGDAILETHLRVGKVRGLWSYLIGSLGLSRASLRGDLCEGSNKREA
jgi:hypothetical protein